MRKSFMLPALLLMPVLLIFGAGLSAQAFAANEGTFQKGALLSAQIYYIKDAVPYGEDQVLVLTDDSRLYSYDAGEKRWAKVSGLPLNDPGGLALLNDGRILIIAGQEGDRGGYHANVIYDPVKKKFASAAPLPQYIADSPTINAVTRTDGKVLVTGRYSLYSKYRYFAYTYDPVSDTWQEAVKLSYAGNALEINHDGDVLNYSGGLSDFSSHGFWYDADADQYHIISALPYVLRFSATTALADGSFLLAGGTYGPGAQINPSRAALVFLPEKNEWRVVRLMKEARAYAVATLLPDGRALVAGGIGVNGRLNTTEIYNPNTDTWTNGPKLNFAYEQLFLLPLGNGDLLALGRVFDAKNEEYFLVAEILKLKSSKVVTYDLDQKPSKLRGTPVARETHFSKDGWTYKAQYRYESDVYDLFRRGDAEYTRMYMTRENAQGDMEIVIDGRYRLLKQEGDTIFFIQDGYLKKMKLGEAYAEVIRFPQSFRVDDPYDSRWNMFGDWSMHAGMPIDLGMQAFDGEYIYTWWPRPAASGFYDMGFPMRIHYTGDYFQILSQTLATEYRANLSLSGDWLTYITRKNNGEQMVLYAVKKDGSEEKELATIIGGYHIIKDRIYYLNENRELYSMKLDGTDKKLHSKRGSGNLHYFEETDTIVFETYDTGTIIQIKADGTDKKTLLQGSGKVQYHLYTAGPNYIVYNKYNGDRWSGTYRMQFPSMKVTKVEGVYDPIRVLVNSELLPFDQDPIMVNNNVMVPFRKMFESLGATVKWDRATGMVTAVKEDISIQINGSQVHVNGKAITLDQPPLLKFNTTFVPLRFISETFGAEVYWIGREKSVHILLEE